MPGGAFISDRPQLAIARADRSFAGLGLNDPNLLRRAYELDTNLDYNPLDELNGLDGITAGKHYLLYLNLPYDGAPDLVNAVLDNLIPQTDVNVFAGVRTVFICTTAVTFATAGITAGNTNDITLVNEGYFISYNPNHTGNGIEGFEEGLIYYIDPITDIDLSAWGVTEVQYYDDLTGHIIQEEGVSLPQRPYLNIIGDDVTATDNEAEKSTDVTFISRVKFFDDEASLPATGIVNVVYVAKDEGTSFYWDGAAYQPIGSAGTDTNIYNSNGSLTADRTVTHGGFIITWSGSKTNATLFNVTNTHATGGSAIQGTSAGSGDAVTGTSNSGQGTRGISTSGIGAYGQSNSGIGVQGRSSSNYGLSAYRFGAGTADIVGVSQILRFSSGTVANGFGAYEDIVLEASDSFGYTAARYGSYWMDATLATRTAALRRTATYKGLEVVTEDTTAGFLQTTTATPANMTIFLNDETCGVIEVTVVGKHNTTDGMIAGKKIFSYIKNGGVLTLGTIQTVLPDDITGVLVGSSYAISAVSNQLSIDVTGVAATINWKATIKIIPNS